MTPPSLKWKSQKLATLESLYNKISTYTHTASLFYFFCFGVYLQTWSTINLDPNAIISTVNVALTAASLLLIPVLTAVIVTLALVLREIGKRIENS